jgi:uncharacterized protein YecE (DUF72 family)
MHGAASTYGGSYSDSQLRMWVKRIEDWCGKKEVFVYFNNDPEGHAITDAKRLKGMCET